MKLPIKTFIFICLSLTAQIIYSNDLRALNGELTRTNTETVNLMKTLQKYSSSLETLQYAKAKQEKIISRKKTLVFATDMVLAEFKTPLNNWMVLKQRSKKLSDEIERMTSQNADLMTDIGSLEVKIHNYYYCKKNPCAIALFPDFDKLTVSPYYSLALKDREPIFDFRRWDPLTVNPIVSWDKNLNKLDESSFERPNLYTEVINALQENSAVISEYTREYNTKISNVESKIKEIEKNIIQLDKETSDTELSYKETIQKVKNAFTEIPFLEKQVALSNVTLKKITKANSVLLQKKYLLEKKARGLGIND